MNEALLIGIVTPSGLFFLGFLFHVERRLSRTEGKLDILLRKNGIDPSSVNKKKGESG